MTNPKHPRPAMTTTPEPFTTLEELDATEKYVAKHDSWSATLSPVMVHSLSVERFRRLIATARLAFERAPSEGREPDATLDFQVVRTDAELLRWCADLIGARTLLFPRDAAAVEVYAARAARVRVLAALPSPVSDPTDTKRLDWVEAQTRARLVPRFTVWGDAIKLDFYDAEHGVGPTLRVAIDAARRHSEAP